LVEGNTEFALDLFRALSHDDANLFISPYSISEALALAYVGARGETARQMAETLHFTLADEDLGPAFGQIDRTLSGYRDEPDYQEGTRFQLQVANAFWGQQGYRFLDGYLDALSARDLEGGLREADFAGAPEEARSTINDWVAEHTGDRIRDLLPEGAVDSATRLVLANAIYFCGSWMFPFEEEATESGTFYFLDGGEAQVPFMHREGGFLQALADGYQVVEMPYVGNKVTMLVIMPEPGEWSSFHDKLDPALLTEVVTGLEYGWVHLSMPRFEIESRYALEAILPELGMRDAFVLGDADFSGMDGTRDLFIATAQHKAFVEVNEQGTEAAAATALAMGAGEPPELVKITLDRPFLFLIRDRQTGTVLFMGQVTDPQS